MRFLKSLKILILMPKKVKDVWLEEDNILRNVGELMGRFQDFLGLWYPDQFAQELLGLLQGGGFE